MHASEEMNTFLSFVIFKWKPQSRNQEPMETIVDEFPLEPPESWIVPEMATVVPATSVCSAGFVRPVTPRYAHKHLNNCNTNT